MFNMKLLLRRLTIILLAGSSLYVAGVRADPELDRLKAALAQSLPGVALESLRPSPVLGFYELEVNTQIVYVSKDGKFLFDGNLFNLQSKENLTALKRGNLVAKLVDGVGDENMIVMGPKRAKRTITVFTDVDCPYCAKMHREVPRLNAGGVRVRYLLYPRNGLKSPTYQRSVSVWCAEDRVEAVAIAKNRGRLETKTCPNPVKRHYQVGQRIGISGTPTIVLDDGQVIGGYMPAAKLLVMLKL